MIGGFIAGVFVGTAIGVLVMALVVMAKQSDERALKAIPAPPEKLRDCRGYDREGNEK